jgi:bifunctional DNA-binding transcriptional regulator/antitoxin component of YhaV-PrlF toxin-antitoxin module
VFTETGYRQARRFFRVVVTRQAHRVPKPLREQLGFSPGTELETLRHSGIPAFH